MQARAPVLRRAHAGLAADSDESTRTGRRDACLCQGRQNTCTCSCVCVRAYMKKFAMRPCVCAHRAACACSCDTARRVLTHTCAHEHAVVKTRMCECERARAPILFRAVSRSVTGSGDPARCMSPLAPSPSLDSSLSLQSSHYLLFSFFPSPFSSSRLASLPHSVAVLPNACCITLCFVFLSIKICYFQHPYPHPKHSLDHLHTCTNTIHIGTNIASLHHFLPSCHAVTVLPFPISFPSLTSFMFPHRSNVSSQMILRIIDKLTTAFWTYLQTLCTDTLVLSRFAHILLC